MGVIARKPRWVDASCNYGAIAADVAEAEGL
jgi:hypothetical protein